LRSTDRLEEGSRQPIINANVLLNVGLKTEHDENDISLDFGPQEADGFQFLKRNGDLTSLIQHMNSLPADIKNKIPNAKLPKDDEAQVLRLILSKENQLVGGYTIIVAGKE
jgi:hypothetical protein